MSINGQYFGVLPLGIGNITPQAADTTQFCIPANNATSTLAEAYSAGSGTLTLTPGEAAAFGTPSALRPIRVTVIHPAALNSNGAILDPTKLAIYKCTDITGATLTIADAQEGTTDQNFPAGSIVGALISAEAFEDLHVAINTVEVGLDSAQTMLTALDADAVKQSGSYTDPEWLTLNTTHIMGTRDGNPADLQEILTYKARTGANSDITSLTSLTGSVTQALGTITSSTPALNSTATWNNVAAAFKHILVSLTNTASAAGSRIIDLVVGGSSKFSVDANGSLSTAGQVRIGTGSDPVGDPNAALVAAWNQHTVIYALGSGFPSLKAICTDTGGATVKMQAATTLGLIGTESNHPFTLYTNNLARFAIGTNGAVAINAPSAGTVVPLTITGTSDQTGNLQDWKASTGVAYASIVALSPTRFGVRAGGTAYLQIGANGSNFPQLLSSSNGILIDTSNQSSGYANVTVLTNSAYGLRVDSGQSNALASADGRFYVATLATANHGIVVRGLTNQTGNYLDLRDNSNATIGGFDGSCNLRAKQLQSFATSVAAPITVDNTVEFGSFNLANTDGAGTLLLALNVNGSGYAQTKLYLISTVWAASSTWKVLRPITSSGPYSGNDCELDAIQSAGAISLRVRRTAGSTAATAAFSAVVLSRVFAPFTATGTTASVTPPTDYFLGGQTGCVPGNFDLGGWIKVGTSADANIPNGGIAWSTDTANALKCRTPAGTLKTITLT